MATYPPNEPQEDSDPNVDVGDGDVDLATGGDPMPRKATEVPATDAFAAGRAKRTAINA